jgi:hypothetical protein
VGVDNRWRRSALPSGIEPETHRSSNLLLCQLSYGNGRPSSSPGGLVARAGERGRTSRSPRRPPSSPGGARPVGVRPARRRLSPLAPVGGAGADHLVGLDRAPAWLAGPATRYPGGQVAAVVPAPGHDADAGGAPQSRA